MLFVTHFVYSDTFLCNYMKRGCRAPTAMISFKAVAGKIYQIQGVEAANGRLAEVGGIPVPCVHDDTHVGNSPCDHDNLCRHSNPRDAEDQGRACRGVALLVGVGPGTSPRLC